VTVEASDIVFNPMAFLTLTSLMTALCVYPSAVLAGAETGGLPPLTADKVVVKKADRQLLLMRDGRLLLGFVIALGDEPVGHKQAEGDWRTPEGTYVIDWRNAESRFYKSLHISYPNAADRQRALEEWEDPGGMIMIHGVPDEAGASPDKYAGKDWTNGCIAVTNAAMDIIWSAVPDGTPIDILP
jgi:murein L,D-transpeptidase YafK